jgi:DNA-binding transcriptional LysR family regulator
MRVPFFSVVPHLIQGSRLLAVVGERIGHHLATTMSVRCFPLPFDIEPWNISAVWPRQGNSQDEAVAWLVTMLRQASALLGSDHLREQHTRGLDDTAAKGPE